MTAHLKCCLPGKLVEDSVPRVLIGAGHIGTHPPPPPPRAHAPIPDSLERGEPAFGIYHVIYLTVWAQWATLAIRGWWEPS